MSMLIKLWRSQTLLKPVFVHALGVVEMAQHENAKCRKGTENGRGEEGDGTSGDAHK